MERLTVVWGQGFVLLPTVSPEARARAIRRELDTVAAVEEALQEQAEQIRLLQARAGVARGILRRALANVIGGVA
jgi:hypothetical protein